MILSWVRGYKIPFTDVPVQIHVPQRRIPHVTEKNDFDKSIAKLLSIGAIKKCDPHPEQFLSEIFLVPKQNGEKRFILNLKSLNNFVVTNHFKMEDLRTALKLMSPDCFMTTIDIKDAYFSVGICEEQRKYLRFQWSQLYEFNVLPFGLSSAPYVFTKIMKPIITHLRNKGIVIVQYLDDFLCINSSYSSCLNDTKKICDLLQSLGFVLSIKKCRLQPNQVCQFLGVIIDSKRFVIYLTKEKKEKIKREVEKFLKIDHCKIRSLAELVGILTSACPAVAYGWVYVKKLEHCKFIALSNNNDDYNSEIALPTYTMEDLSWWKINIQNSFNKIRLNNFACEIFSDASKTGWGIVCGNKKSNGKWSIEESKMHINYLELLSAFFALKIFAAQLKDCEILLRIDNTTAIAYINKMGGVQYTYLNDLARAIWQWCEHRDIYVTASYVSSKDNFEADSESRVKKTETEWQLADYAYDTIIRELGQPEIDLFASRLNKKCKLFISWKPDPEAYRVDAFTCPWERYFFYAFPPFCLILKTLNKIIQDKAEGIVVVPLWPSQPWYPIFKKLLKSRLVSFKPSKKLLSSPFSNHHPLHDQLTLVAGILSARP